VTDIDDVVLRRASSEARLRYSLVHGITSLAHELNGGTHGSSMIVDIMNEWFNGDDSKVEALCERAIGFADTPRIRAWGACNLATYRIDHGDAAGAIQLIGWTVDMDPSFLPGVRNYAYWNLFMGNRAVADSMFKRRTWPRWPTRTLRESIRMFADVYGLDQQQSMRVVRELMRRDRDEKEVGMNHFAELVLSPRFRPRSWHLACFFVLLTAFLPLPIGGGGPSGGEAGSGRKPKAATAPPIGPPK
jgi:hypothetical protein